MSGPRPQPTAIKAAKGNTGHRPLPKDEPEPEALPESAPAPAGLSDAARAEWKLVAPRLARARVLSDLDVEAVEQLCEIRATLRVARAEQAKVRKAGGLLVKNHGQLVPHPIIGLVSKLHDEELRRLVEFGMTASSRSKVKKTAPAKAGNAFNLLPGGKAAG